MNPNSKENNCFLKTDSGKSKSNSIDIPSISLPKGGGAIKGLDEKFEVNAANGTTNLSIGIPVSPGRNGFTPEIGLGYNSGGGNSPFGLGWQLGLGSIRRKTDKGLPRYGNDDEDVFQLTGAEDLIPYLIETGPDNWEEEEKTTADGYTVKRYRPRIESGFVKIEKICHVDHGTYWKITAGDNTVTIYGRDEMARISDPTDSSKIFQWFPEFSYNDKGNWIKYIYKPEDLDNVPNLVYEENRLEGVMKFSNRYLKKIQYGNLTPYFADETLPYDPFDPTLVAGSIEENHFFDLVFDYGEHDELIPTIEQAPDQKWEYRADPFSSRRSGFEIRTNRLCKRVLMFHTFEELGEEPCLVKSLDLEYEPSNMNGSGQTEVTYLSSATQSGYIKNKDNSYSKKSLPAIEYTYQSLEWNTVIKKIDQQNIANAPVGLSDNYQWVDLYNEGISGIFSEQADAWYYKENLGDSENIGAQFSVANVVKSIPSFKGLNHGELVLQDLESNGQKQVTINTRKMSGFFEVDELNSKSGEEQGFRSFKNFPTVNLKDPNTRLFDLTGDGIADIVITEENAFVWHKSLGKEGYGSAERTLKAIEENNGPALVFSERNQSIFLADITGDGLTDIVRIRNGEIVYWSNEGYGNFSAKITMGNAPYFDSTDQYDSRLLHLADISGTGAMDIIYLGKNEFRSYINHSGNSWSQPFQIDPFVQLNKNGKLSVVDLLGTGTACIVWSTNLPDQSPMRYIDLMASKKPHLLIGYHNNSGKEVSFEYKSSTYFYLKDKREGNPWITKLPFPVHVITKTRSEDKISETVFASTYSYHHGYFDFHEREFRGFARVEQRDTEDFSEFKLNVAKNVVEEELHQPPVKTISWFHTGAFIDRTNMLHQLREEYFKNPSFTEWDLPESSIEADLSLDEYREAMRAFKGTPLHIEIYAADDTTKSEYPFSSQSSSYEIKRLQPQKNNRFASFQVIPVENISYGYERNPEDPRISHSFILETDELGNVLKNASVIYPRIKRPIAPNEVPDRVWNEQNKLHIVYGETEFTNDIKEDDLYRLRVSYESRAYELNGISQPIDFFFKRNELHNAIKTASTILYEEDFTTGVERRLVSHSRAYFMKDDLSGPLPLGEPSPLGIGYNNYQLAFTKNLVSKYYGAKVNDTMLIDAKYVHSEGDEHWWTQGGTVVFDPNPKSNFYLPIGGVDVFGNVGTMTYDDYFLLLKSTTNAIGHSATAIHDYRTLSPVMMIDPNMNRSAIEMDELGIVIKTAIMGKEGAGEGDTLDNPTTRIEYDLFNWQHNQKPNYVHSYVREQHGVETPIWQESFTYFDGDGTGILSKVQAEPGIAKEWNPITKEIDEIAADPRWIGNGRTIFNNKGNPIKAYDPYFSTTHEYEAEDELVETGFTPIIYYDAAGRSIRTELPDGTLTKSEFDAWYGKSYDASDTVKDSDWYSDRGSPDPTIDPEPADPEERAAWLAAKNHNTPSIGHTNSLGQVFYSITDYGNGKTTNAYTENDLASRYTKVFDYFGRLVSEAYTNLLKTPIYSKTAEKGERWTFLDVMSRPVKIWDNGLFELRVTFDEIHRPVSTFVKQGAVETLHGHMVYGDILVDAVAKNVVGKPYKSFDQSGVVTIKNVDFKGNVTHVDRSLCKEYKQIINWQVLDGLNNIVAIEAAALPFLENETFEFEVELDALNRPLLTTLPDGSLIKPTYNEANMLESLQVKVRGLGDFKTYLEEQDYNEKGERQYVKLGNGLITNYFHDPKTFRLVNLITKPLGDSDANSVQNLTYTFDPLGNIVYLKDNAQQTHYFKNAVVKAESFFEYDAVNQLIKATGREHAITGTTTQPNHESLPFLSELPQNNNSNAVRNYTQTYQYDDLGNIQEMKHVATNGNWTRQYHYAYEVDPLNLTNQLASTSQPSDPIGGPYSDDYSYDSYGNMTKMAHLNELVWNFMGQLKEVDLGGGGKGYYVYDSSGNRTRKVVERIGGKRLERIYLGSIEIYREYQGLTKKLERNTLHISDNTGRIAQVDTKLLDVDNTDVDNPLNVDLIRYQYGNHIGSATIETDEKGVVISYEEYHPFGTSAYRNSKSGTNLSLKRYRYTGQERDDETGFYHMGARYYASWLGRWTSTDPAGFADGFNLYRYSRNNPIMLSDPSGTNPDRVQGTPTLAIQRARRQNTAAARAIIDRAYPVGAEVQGHHGRYRITGGSYWNGRENRLTWEAITGGSSSRQTGTPTPTPAPAPTPTPPTPPATSPPANDTPSSSGGGGVAVVPIRPLVQPGPIPSTGVPDRGVPALDITQAPPGTNFRRAERTARGAYRAEHGITGRQTAVQHPQKWLEGQRTNTHPRITNDPRFLHPIDNRRGTGGLGDNGRPYATQHTLADRGRYPSELNAVRRRYGSRITERVSTLWAGQRVRQRTSPGLGRGPLFLREYNFGRVAAGVATTAGLGLARNMIPLFAEAEIGIQAAGMYAVANGVGAGTVIGEVAVLAATAPATVASIALVSGAAGYFVGGAVGHAVEDLTDSRAAGVTAGTLTGAAVGAGVGAAVGVWFFGIGAAPGAVIGGVVGAIGGFIGSFW